MGRRRFTPNKRNVDEMELMEKFFRDHIVAKKGSAVKTVDVMTKSVNA